MLTPTVAQNTGLLRLLADPLVDAPWHYKTLAARLERDEENTRKSCLKLMAEGVVAYDAGQVGLTDAGRNIVAALDVAEGKAAGAGDGPADYLALPHARISPDPLNPRTDWDSPAAVEALDELAADILANGLLQNLVVKPAGTDANGVRFSVVGGERRWRAIGRLIEAGDWPADRLIACKRVEVDELGHRIAALAENLKRRQLNPIEEAQAFEGLIKSGIKPGELAERVNCTPEMIQQRRRLLQLSPAEQADVAAKRLRLHEALQRVAKVKPAPELSEDEAVLLVQLALFLGLKKVDKLPSHRMVDRDAIGDANLGRLVELGLVGHYREHATQAETVYLNRDAVRAIQHYAPEFFNNTDPNGPVMERANPRGDTFSTPWLNSPRRISEAGMAEMERRNREHQAREADRQRVMRERDAADQKIREDKAEEMRAGRTALLAVRRFEDDTAGLAGADLYAAFADLLRAIPAPGPWAIRFIDGRNGNPDPMIHDADGKPNAAYGAEMMEARRRVMTLGVNIASGNAAISGPWDEAALEALAEEAEAELEDAAQ